MNFEFWKNRNVFITGHTGFKGGWISHWLTKMGANVFGYSLPPPTSINFFDLTRLKEQISGSFIEDILDLNIIKQSMKEANPSVVIHMAAQPLVKQSYDFPIETYKTNIIGSLNVFEAARNIKDLKAIINITTDKCYENYEQATPYIETDRLGGYDPYSSSKACSELVSSSYRNSFLRNLDIHIATARGGNVIGGGDWAKDRLIPDFFKSLEMEQSFKIRSPDSVRPWQHVLEPIYGYLMLAEKLVLKGDEYAEAWNFGPNENNMKTVSEIIDYLLKKTKKIDLIKESQPQIHETKMLKIDSSKAVLKLGWRQQWDIETALNKTIDWYKAWQNKEDLIDITISQISDYEKKLKK